MPTAVFFNADEGRVQFGRDAIAEYLAGTEGRLMRSLKSLLGSPLLRETTVVNHQQVSYQDIIATFLTALRERASQALGHAPTRVVMGRPVHFVDDDAARDAQAQASLQQAAQAVGFTEVAFQLEPIAAALDHERRLQREAVVLVADIGGGTSDFTVVRLGPDRIARADRTRDVLATRGVHLGGTDFDQTLSLARAMPLLGLGHHGPQQREVPSRVFFDLATWHLIHWLYQPKALAQAQGLRVNYSDLRLHDRLMKLLRQRDGHRLADAVERAKIQCSQQGSADIALPFIDAGLAVTLDADGLARHLAPALATVVACARDCVQAAGLGAGALDAVYLTGGSSALRPFQQVLQAAFPAVPLVEGDLFGGVAAGLAYTRAV